MFLTTFDLNHLNWKYSITIKGKKSTLISRKACILILILFKNILIIYGFNGDFIHTSTFIEMFFILT